MNLRCIHVELLLGAHSQSERPWHISLERTKPELIWTTNSTVLINNVGISVFEGINFRPLFELPEAHIAKLIDVNTVFPTQLTHALLPMLIKSPSALILNLGSAAGVFPAIYTSVYGACKAYQFHLTRILRNELRAEHHNHIEVTSVLIGFVQSAGTKEFISRPSIFAPSSQRYASAVINSVGRDKEMINPYWPHLLQMALPQWLPSRMLAYLTRRAGIKMKATEQRQLQEHQQQEPSKLAEPLVN